MISIHRFEYAGYSSEDFDLCCQLSFDDSSGETSTFLSREAVSSETYRGEIQRVSSYKYTDVLAPTITLIDKNFEEFDLERQRTILRWLTSKHTPSFITIYHDDSNVVSYEILGAFTELNTYKNGSGHVIGFTGVYTSISPYAFSRLYTETKGVLDSASNTFTIKIDTDEPKSAVYPKITIQHNGSNYIRIADGTQLNIHSDMIVNAVYFNGTTYYWKTSGVTKQSSTTKPSYDWIVKEVNHAYDEDEDDWEIGYIYQYGSTYYWLDPNTFHSDTTNPELETIGVKITNTYAIGNQTYTATCRVANNTLDEKIVLDGANKVISSSRTSRVFGDDFSWEWLPLYDKSLANGYDGTNTIKVEGNCTVTIEYREIRKVGEM